MKDVTGGAGVNGMWTEPCAEGGGLMEDAGERNFEGAEASSARVGAGCGQAGVGLCVRKVYFCIGGD